MLKILASELETKIMNKKAKINTMMQTILIMCNPTLESEFELKFLTTESTKEAVKMHVTLRYKAQQNW